MDVNTCEHGDHPAPAGKRFCSDACRACESTMPSDENQLTEPYCARVCVSKMRNFEERDIWEARDYALHGGQALHCHFQLGSTPPRCFVRDVNAGKAIGHLFDQDIVRLKATARRLGVRVVVVERIGKPYQHVDLCGAPMAKATAECAGSEAEKEDGDE